MCAVSLEAHKPGLSLIQVPPAALIRGSGDHKPGWGSESAGPKEALDSDPNVPFNSLRCYLVTSMFWALQPSYKAGKYR